MVGGGAGRESTQCTRSAARVTLAIYCGERGPQAAVAGDNCEPSRGHVPGVRRPLHVTKGRDCSPTPMRAWCANATRTTS